MADKASEKTTSRCPWCSAVVPAGAETCPSCGAALVATAEGGVPGLTSVDEAAALRRLQGPKPRPGLLGFLSGETGDTVEAPSEAELSSIAPPGTDVRIEMMRIELDAERQRLEGEAAGLAAEAVAEGGASSLPPGLFDEPGAGAGPAPRTTDGTDLPTPPPPGPGE